jgi:hypothetical protein
VDGVLGGKMFDLGLARMRVPVRRARLFMERMKAEERRIRRVVVDIFSLLVGGLWSWFRGWELER